MKTVMNGVMEIDHERGVIYFHLQTSDAVKYHKIATPLRISGLPRPIPLIQGRSLDIGFRKDDSFHPMHPVTFATFDWEGKM